MKTLHELLDRMWADYIDLNPQALKIYQGLQEKGEKVVNDHIALRTFNDPRIGLQVLAEKFTRWGYELKGEYHFEEKHLYAQHFEHKEPGLPKIFISELLIEKFDPEFQQTVKALLKNLPADISNRDDLAIMGRPWQVDIQTYEKLAQKSEYAAWMSAYGFRVNHFTVFFNSLKKFADLKELNKFIEGLGYTLNKSGGEIKGTPQEYLEQSSTMANKIKVAFSDGTVEIPACYYEFARRYPLADGKLYPGFIAKSADKIFESTNRY